MTKKNLPVIFILLFAGIMYFLNRGYCPIGSFHDDAYYVLSARYLAGVSSIEVGSFTRPIGYTLLLTPVAKLFPHSKVLPFKIFTIILYLCALFFVFKVFEDRFRKKWEAYLFVGLCAFNPIIFQYSPAIMNEAGFIFFTYLSIYLLRRYLDAEYDLKVLVLLAFSLAWLGLVRVEGIFLGGLVFLYFLHAKRRKNALFFFLFFALFLLPLMLKGGGRGYNYKVSLVNYIYSFTEGNVFDLVKTNIIEYLNYLPDSLVFPFYRPGDVHGIQVLFGIVIAVFIIAGFLRPIFTPSLDRIIRIYISVYAVIHLLLAAHRYRYFVAFIPFMLFFLIRGIDLFFSRARCYIQCIIMVMYLVAAYAATVHKKPPPPYQETISYIKENIPKDAKVAVNLNYTYSFYTDRNCIGASHAYETEDEHFAYYADADVDYIVLFYIHSPGTKYSFAQFNVAANKRRRRILINKDRYDVVWINYKEKSAILKPNEEFKKSFVKAMDVAEKAQKKLKTGDLEAAERLYLKAIKINGKIPVIINNLSFIYFSQGRLEKAKEILFEGIKNCPQSPMLYNLLGEVFFQEGNLPEAEKYFKKALANAEWFYDSKAEDVARKGLTKVTKQGKIIIARTEHKGGERK